MASNNFDLQFSEFTVNKSKYAKKLNFSFSNSNLLELKIEQDLIFDLFIVLNGLSNLYQGSITLNGLDFKTILDVRKYIQKHTLFLTKRPTFIENLYLKNNFKILSILWSNHDLSEVALKFFDFSLDQIQNKNLTKEDIRFISSAKLLICPARFWIIDKEAIIFEDKIKQEKIDRIIQSKLDQEDKILILKRSVD